MDTLGIDIAKLTFDATLLKQTGTQHYASFPTAPRASPSSRPGCSSTTSPPCTACMEATNIYWQALASWLHAHGYTVSVVNPARIKGYAQATMQRNKTDKLDSALIVSFCAKHQPAAWQPASEQQRRLRALVRYRDDLLQTQLQQQNRLRDATDELVKGSLQTLLKAIASELAALEARIKEQMLAQQSLQTNLSLLTSIVGIGVVTAAKLLSEFSELEQYESAKAAAADAGLSPSQFESGTSVRRRPRMSKLGKAGVRAALYWPAITAMTRCPAFKAFADRLAARGKEGDHRCGDAQAGTYLRLSVIFGDLGYQRHQALCSDRIAAPFCYLDSPKLTMRYYRADSDNERAQQEHQHAFDAAAIELVDAQAAQQPIGSLSWLPPPPPPNVPSNVSKQPKPRSVMSRRLRSYENRTRYRAPAGRSALTQAPIRPRYPTRPAAPGAR